jgi:5'-nucleotidase
MSEGIGKVIHLPITCELNLSRNGEACSREFGGQTGCATLTAEPSVAHWRSKALKGCETDGAVLLQSNARRSHHGGRTMTEPEKPIVALFDLDGTLADHNGELHRRLDQMRSPAESLDVPFQIAWETAPGYLRERMKAIRGNPGFWINLPPLRAGFEILEAAHSLGFQIEILSKGPRHSPIAWMEKLQWCDQHLAAYPHQVTITMDKGLVYGNLLVDDYPEYVLRWLRWRKRGMVVMPDQPWNRDFEHPQVYRYLGDQSEMVTILERVVARTKASEPG